MFRSALLKIASRAKGMTLIDPLVRLNPLLHDQILKIVENFHNASPETLHLLIKERCRAVLAAARKTDYGKNFSDDIDAWPILKKDTMRSALNSLVNRRVFLRVPASTGGTTGIPVKLWRSLGCVAAEQIFLDKLLKPYGFTMHGSRMAVMRADSIKPMSDSQPPYGRFTHGGKRLTLSSSHLTPGTLDWFYRTLKDFSPSILWIYPSAIINFIKLMENKDLHLQIPVILTSSEQMQASLSVKLKDYFGSVIVDYYGQAERVCFAYGDQPGKFFFDPAYGKVELEECEREAEEDTQRAFSVIGTGYWNLAMPLVRYNTGDVVHLPANISKTALSEITEGRQPFGGLSGRAGEYIIAPDGMQIMGLNHLPRELDNVLQMQLVQSAPELVQIRVIATDAFGRADIKTITDHARAKIPYSIEIEIIKVDRLMVTGRGKTPFIVRNFEAV